MDTITGIAPIELRCPCCGSELGDVPASLPAEVECGRCGFCVASDAENWDACVDRAYPRDFARQWVLWEQGRLGDPSLVYGERPEHYFHDLLASTGLRADQLESMRVLEVGFGHGRLLRQIQAWSPAAYGIDLAKPLRSADLRSGSAFFGSLLQMPFSPGQFDLVVCRGVIHHTPEPEASFGCVADQVAEGGILYLGGCYEPGGRGMLVLRKLLPWSWNYPEPVLLGLARVLGGLRSALETVRCGTLDLETMRSHYAHYKLDVYDVMTPRWSGTLGAETIVPWFESRGLQVRKASYGTYVGIKAGPDRIPPASAWSDRRSPASDSYGT